MSSFVASLLNPLLVGLFCQSLTHLNATPLLADRHLTSHRRNGETNRGSTRKGGIPCALATSRQAPPAEIPDRAANHLVATRRDELCCLEDVGSRTATPFLHRDLRTTAVYQRPLQLA